jgi:AraC-like DNA-binding protein
MRVYTCLPEELERQFWGKMPESARRMNVLDIERVERDVQSGAFRVFVTAPAEVSPTFFSRLRKAVASSASTLVLWTAFDQRVLRTLVAAGGTDRVELFFRGDPGDDAALHSWLRSKGRKTARAAVLCRLTAMLEDLDVKFARVVLGVILGRFHEATVPALLKTRGLKKSWFARHLQQAGLCHGRSLMHLGRLMTAFDRLTSTNERVGTVALLVRYPSARALGTNAKRFIGCSPTGFRRLTPEIFADRIVAALQR